MSPPNLSEIAGTSLDEPGDDEEGVVGVATLRAENQFA